MTPDNTPYCDKASLDFIIDNLHYPAPFVKHPDIGHLSVANKLFQYMEPKQMKYEEHMTCHILLEYMTLYQATYLALCKDFETYEEYLQEQHWEEFKNRKNKIKIL